MDESKRAWDEVAKRLSDLGGRLNDRYKKPGDEGEADRRRLNEALRTFTDELDRAFTSLGDTLRDPGTKDEVTKAAQSIGDAVAATFSEVGQEIRRRISSKKPPSDDGGSS